MGGDSDAIWFPSEKKGGRVFSRVMEAFSHFIDSCELIDLPLSAGRFTWSSGPFRGAMNRLDRFLVSEEWEALFPGANQVKLFLPISDHCPIIFYSEEIDWGPKPFQFNNDWLLYPNFVALVKNWWDTYVIHGWAGFVLFKKLNMLKWKIREWAASNGGSILEKKDLAVRDLEHWSKLEEDRDLDEGEATAMKLSKSTLWDCLRMEEVEWR